MVLLVWFRLVRLRKLMSVELKGYPVFIPSYFRGVPMTMNKIQLHCSMPIRLTQVVTELTGLKAKIL